jgi:hypothetical protein
LIREALDELSPEFLAHASNKARNAGRYGQADKLFTGAKRAFDRDYGWEYIPDREGRNTSFSYDEFHGMDGGIHRNIAEPDKYASSELRPAQRKKYFDAKQAKHRMKHDMRPDGTSYAEAKLDEAWAVFNKNGDRMYQYPVSEYEDQAMRTLAKAQSNNPGAGFRLKRVGDGDEKSDAKLDEAVSSAIRKMIVESDSTDMQWKSELAEFMRGLRNGQYEVNEENDMVYVQIWKRGTAENDPRYVYFRRGDNRLHDDHFYMQDSPKLSTRTINVINRTLGWSDDEYGY